jgi:hypothetical protein
MRMKKLLLSLAAMFVAVTISAQDTKAITWGVEAGMNVNSLSFNDILESSNRLGFFVGPKAKFRIPLLGFGADAAVLYNMNNAEYVLTGASKSLSYLEVPLNVRYSFGIKAISVYVATGPQFNYCLSSDASLNELYGNDLTSFSRSTWGWNVGAGVELFSHLQVGVSYTIPISNSGKLTLDEVGNIFTNFNQKTVKVRLAYFF